MAGALKGYRRYKVRGVTKIVVFPPAGEIDIDWSEYIPKSRYFWKDQHVL